MIIYFKQFKQHFFNISLSERDCKAKANVKKLSFVLVRIQQMSHDQIGSNWISTIKNGKRSIYFNQLPPPVDDWSSQSYIFRRSSAKG